MSDSALEIPGYTLHGLLGKGGMAEVYLATQESLRRKVAIKVLSNIEDRAYILRFIKEGHLVASLHHPSIITIYDIDQLADGRYYLAMEYLSGGDLTRHKGEVFEPERALAIIRQIASGLQVVHDKGLIHRDVKPANILFRADGTAVLTDFGVAKDVDIDSELTHFGIAVGSPAYSSPEQAQCEPLDARSDIYSLGVILLEMLTGSNPFRGGSYTQTVMNHLQMPVPELPQDLAPLQDVLECMLAKEPAERFADCRELLAALDESEAHDLGKTRISPTAAASRTDGAKRRGRLLPISLGVLLLAATLTGGGLYLRQQMRIDDLLAQAEQRLSGRQLVEPVQDSAEHYFHEVLRLDQDNPAALAGLERVRQARIDDWLALGEQRLAEGRLLTPADDNADFYFRQALALEDGNARALDGLQRVLEARIAGNLARAEQRIAERRLLQPEEDSAVYYYRAILGWVPDQPQALAGLQRIAALFRDQANGAYRRGNFPEALAMIERGLQVQPDDPELLAMQREHRQLLASARAEKSARARRAAATPAKATEPEPEEAPQENPIKRVWNNLFGN